MSFLNATLILGTLAAVIPVVLHLIARREPKKVLFPSIVFLNKKFETNRSRLKVRRWWLLAMRILAVAALAIALARPAIHRSLSLTWLTIGLLVAAGIALLVMATVSILKSDSRKLGYGLTTAALVVLLMSMIWGAITFASGPSIAMDSNGPAAVAIVVDNSLTSGWKTASDDRLASLRDTGTWLITQLPRTSRVAVIDRSSTPASFSLDVAGAMSKLEQVSPQALSQPIASRIDAAVRLVRTSDLENRQVFVITDLARSTWGESLDDDSLTRVIGEGDVAVTVFDLGKPVGGNVSLSVPKLADATPPKNVPVSLTVEVQSQVFSADEETPAEATTVAAELQLFENTPSLPVVRDGEVVYPPASNVDRTATTLRPGQSAELLLTLPGLPIGTHHGRVRLTSEDGLDVDNERFFSIEVMSPSSVLVVSDDVTEADVMIGAITSSSVAVAPEDAEFSAERIGNDDLSVARLSDFDSIVLMDSPPSAIADAALAKYLNSGGNALICLGPSSTGIESSPASTDWMPKVVRRWRVPEPGTFFEVTSANHPATASLSQDTPWNDFSISQYWQVESSPTDRILIRYAGTDHVAMMQRSVATGEDSDENSDETNEAGKLIVMTTPLVALTQNTRGWNRLFGLDPWPAWLLTRQTIEYLTGRSGDRAMTSVGQPKTIVLRKSEDGLAGGSAGGLPGDQATSRSRLQWFPPGGVAPVPVDIDEATTEVTLTDIREAGVYYLRGSQEKTSPGMGFTANFDSRSVNLDPIEATDLDRILGADAYAYVNDRDELQLADQQAAQRISLASPAMLVALMVFLLEQILGNRFYKSS